LEDQTFRSLLDHHRSTNPLLPNHLNVAVVQCRRSIGEESNKDKRGRREKERDIEPEMRNAIVELGLQNPETVLSVIEIEDDWRDNRDVK